MTDPKKKNKKKKLEQWELDDLKERREWLISFMESGDCPTVIPTESISEEGWNRIVQTDVVRKGIIPIEARDFIEFVLNRYRKEGYGRIYEVLNQRAIIAEQIIHHLGVVSDLMRKYREAPSPDELWGKKHKEPMSLDEDYADDYPKHFDELSRVFRLMAGLKRKIGHRQREYRFYWLVFDLDTIVRFYSRGEKHIDRSKKMRAFVVEVGREVKNLPKDTSADDAIMYVVGVSEMLEKEQR
jgi:hypothetical protein